MNLYRKKEYEKSQEVWNFEENGICFFERKLKKMQKYEILWFFYVNLWIVILNDETC